MPGARAMACPTGGSARSSSRRARSRRGSSRGSRRRRRRTGSTTSGPSGRRSSGRWSRRSRGVAGLLSPSTGIIDSHALMLSYRGELEDAGGAVALSTRFLAARPVRGGGGEGFVVEAESGERAGDARLRPPRQRRRPLRRRGRGRHRGAGGAVGAAGLLLQGQLLRARGPGAVLAPRLSGARARRARDPPDPRPRRARALRAGHRVGRGHRLFARRRAGARASTRRSGATGRSSPTGRSPRTIPASGRSSRPRAARPPTS